MDFLLPLLIAISQFVGGPRVVVHEGEVAAKVAGVEAAVVTPCTEVVAIGKGCG